MGGQVTYYMILSFFPLLIFFLTLLGYANISSERFFQDLKYLLPEETYLMVESIIYEIFALRSPTLLSFGMLGAVWASLNGITALIRGIVKAYGLTEERSYLRLKLTSIAALGIITIAIIASFSLLFIGERIGNTIFENLGETGLFSFFWHKIRLLIQFLLLVITCLILNRMATSSRFSLKMLLPGSILAVSAWIVLSLAFSYYLGHFNNFSVTYGSIAGVIILLLWLYWSIEVLLLGCALNAVIIDAAGKEIQPNII